MPINVNPQKQGNISELTLYVSSDKGLTWYQAGHEPPSAKAFQYKAPADGEYWFQICVVDKQGKREPENLYKSAPGAKVIIQMTKPHIRLSVDRNGDQIAVSWDIRSENPNPASLKLEYRTSETPYWMPVPVGWSLNSQASFRPSSLSSTTVRMEVRDTAGNIGEAVREVSGMPAGTMLVGGIMPTPPAPPAAVPPPIPTPPPLPSPPLPIGVPSPYATPSPDAVPTPRFSPSPTYTPLPLRDNNGGAWDPTVAIGPRPLPSIITPPAYGPQTAPSYTRGSPPSFANPGNSQCLASSVYNPLPVAAPQQTPGTQQLYGTPPRLHMVNSRQVTLDYEVANCGPSGLGSVDVWISQNEGRTWQHYYNEENLNMAGPPDIKPGLGALRRSITVELPGEGVYGLSLVVQSGAKRGKWRLRKTAIYPRSDSK